MEAQFTVRDTLQNFVDWVNGYGMAKQENYVPQTLWHLVNGRFLEHLVPSGGHITFTITVEAPKQLRVTARTRKWNIEADHYTNDTEDAELHVYFAELVRAARWEWTDEPGLNELERFYLKAVRERPREKGKLDDYCNMVGCTDQTLRNRNRRFIEMGIETGWTKDMKPKNLA